MTQPQRLIRRDKVDSGEKYLEAAVRTATPARLRLMLIERAIGVAATLANSWQEDPKAGTNEHSIKLLDLLNELLDGVKGGDSTEEQKLCRTVADMYVFLAKHLVAAESNSDVEAVIEIKTVLEADAETWRAVCVQEQPAGSPDLTGKSADSAISPAGSTGLNLQG